MDLAVNILSDPINKWLFKQAGREIFLVGGYVRDLIRCGEINKDKDYIISKNAREIAAIASRKFKGTFIELKKDQTFRVALKDGQFLDFSQMRNSIVEDLSKRDFRINAISWSNEKGLIDPLDGMSDLRNKIIRVIHHENLAEDPLRVLRAYRLAAQLGFTIDAHTRNYLRKYSSRLIETAEERITEELHKLLTAENSSFYISLAEDDKVLHKILGVTNANIRLNLIMLIKFDRFIDSIRHNKFKKIFNSRIRPILNDDIGQGLSRHGLMRLSILLNGMNSSKGNISGRLKFSNSVIKQVKNIQKAMSQCTGKITTVDLYNMFRAADDSVYEAALLVSVTRQRNVDKFFKRADDFIKSRKKPLLDGYEIQKILSIDPSEQIGVIQDKIQKRRFLGITRTKTQARRWITSNFT